MHYKKNLFCESMLPGKWMLVNKDADWILSQIPNRRNASGEKTWNAFWGEDFGEKVGHCKRFIKT